MKKLIKLKQTCSGCPEQWEGLAEDGGLVYARERHGEVRVELDGAIILECKFGTALDALYRLFIIPDEIG